MVRYTEESLKGHLPFSLCLESPWPAQKKRPGFRAFVCPHISGQSSCFHSAGLLHRGHFSRPLDVYVAVMETIVHVSSAQSFDSGRGR